MAIWCAAPIKSGGRVLILGESRIKRRLVVNSSAILSQRLFLLFSCRNDGVLACSFALNNFLLLLLQVF